MINIANFYIPSGYICKEDIKSPEKCDFGIAAPNILWMNISNLDGN